MFDVWKNVLAKLEQELSASSFLTWFDSVELLDIKDGTVIVGVPNVFKIKHIENRYNDKIKQALIENDVKFERVEYVLKSDAPKVKKGREVTTEEVMTPEKARKEHDGVRVPVRGVKQSTTGLSERYRMDNFVVGSNNDLAVSVAKAVIEHPGGRYNPFFLYGGPGLGKTHLVQAIGNEVLKNNPKLRVLYIPINHFYTEFVGAVRKGGMDEFRKKYREVDLLIIDDFQFIVGKEKSQEEFFNIFNDMHQAEKQIIVTSDRLPSQIKTVDERLASRLTMGGAFDLQMPSFEDRSAILQSMAEFMGVEIEPEAIQYLAENVKTNIRDLDREFKQIIAMAELRGMTPLELISGGYIDTTVRSSSTSKPTAKKIVEKVAKYYDLSVKEMCGKSRVAHIKTARQVAMYLLSEELQMSTTQITSEVGVKDHTTVMHGIKKIKSDLRLNFTLREQISEIRGSIYE